MDRIAFLSLILSAQVIYSRSEREKFPFLLEKNEDRIFIYDFPVTPENSTAMSETAEQIFRTAQASVKSGTTASLLLEEILMLIYEKNAGKKKLFAECTILSEPAGMWMILRDSGILFDVTDADSLPDSLRQYVVARMMVAHDKKAYLTTTGYNRIELFSAKMTTVETVVQLSKGNISSQNVKNVAGPLQWTMVRYFK